MKSMKTDTLLWGQYQLISEMHQRLQGKITDPKLAGRSLNVLGLAYWLNGPH